MTFYWRRRSRVSIPFYVPSRATPNGGTCLDLLNRVLGGPGNVNMAKPIRSSIDSFYADLPGLVVFSSPPGSLDSAGFLTDRVIFTFARPTVTDALVIVTACQDYAIA